MNSRFQIYADLLIGGALAKDKFSRKCLSFDDWCGRKKPRTLTAKKYANNKKRKSMSKLSRRKNRR
jgi:hypothetical protein